MLLRVFAALILATPTAAIASGQTTTTTTAATPPVDAAARAKFPAEDGQFVDALAAVNRFVNANMTYVDDKSHYGHDDLWVMAPDDGKGDCEDFALTKEFVLFEAGFHTIENTKLVLVLVHEKGQTFGHAILAVRMPHGSVAYMDLRDELMTRQELKAKGYEFFDW